MEPNCSDSKRGLRGSATLSVLGVIKEASGPKLTKAKEAPHTPRVRATAKRPAHLARFAWWARTAKIIANRAKKSSAAKA